MARYRSQSLSIITLGVSLCAVALFALTGFRVAQNTYAATANPYGSADYCALENNSTVIYGWAADPDATSLTQPVVALQVGDTTVNASTNRADYRNKAIQSWIDSNRRGDQKPGTYGFRVALSGLTKGNKYSVSGTVLNEGPGANVILTINNSAYVDDDKKKPYFADNVIPDSCLVDPAAAMQPLDPVETIPAPKPAASSITGATVTAGTMAAELQINTENTVTVRVMYGTDPLKLDQSSSDVLITGAKTTVTLSGLNASETYNYRVVRTDPTGKRTTSPLGSFDTLGFAVAVHFVDSRDRGIQGIIAQLDDQPKSKTSDDNGTVQFTGIASGQHTVRFSYLGRNLSKTLSANASTVAPSIAAAPQVVTLDNVVDMQALLASVSMPAAKPKSNTALVAAVIALVIVAILIGIILFLLRTLKRRKEYESWMETPAPPLPEYKPLDPQLPPVVPVQPGADHMGKSLKKMVVEDYTHPPKKDPPGTPD